MSAPVLRVEGLSASIQASGRPRTPVLRDVSLDVAPGELVGIVGETGAGKSLTARAILGTLPASAAVDAGSIRLGSRDLRDPKMVRSLRGREIGYVPQTPRLSLDPVFTVGSQLRDVIRRDRSITRRAATDRARTMLEKVQIADSERVLRSYPHQLSGGLCQRVCIALALANDPVLVIADEPTTGLDVTVQHQILEMLRGEIASSGRAGLIVTHDLGVVATWCDRVAVMYAGRVVAFGETASVIGRSAHPYAAGLVEIATALDDGRQAVAIPGTVPSLGELPPGCAFAPRCLRASERCAAIDPEVRPIENQLVRCHHPLVGVGVS